MNQVLVQSDNSIVAVGYSEGQFALSRCDANGTNLDGEFGTGVHDEPQFHAGWWTWATCVAWTTTSCWLESSMWVKTATSRWELNADGTPDMGFGRGGVATTDNGDNTYACILPGGLAMNPDGTGIYVAGAIYNGTTYVSTLELLHYVDAAAALSPARASATPPRSRAATRPHSRFRFPGRRIPT